MSAASAAGIARLYLRFADEQFRGRSPLYEELARGVARDPPILDFLLGLPRDKRQPNLLFAAARSLVGTPTGWDEFRQTVLDNPERLRALMLARSTQTNEPGRCATLLPALARLTQPLALIEVGASAGLCLIPDRYAYDCEGHLLHPMHPVVEPPIFPCIANAQTPIPSALPQIVWRAGIDIHPIDVHDSNQTAWLETLVWPEQTDRLARLRVALAVAAADPPRVVRGDLRCDLEALAREAPRDATLVIFHTAVLPYVAVEERTAFARLVGSLCDFWIANEAPSVLPVMAALPPLEGREGWYLLAVNGVPIAWTDPHGAALDWIG